MGAEVAAVVEVLAALWTGRRELARALVYTPVVLVVAQLAELFAALQTVERLLARVRAHVNLRQQQHICQKREKFSRLPPNIGTCPNIKRRNSLYIIFPERTFPGNCLCENGSGSNTK